MMGDKAVEFFASLPKIEVPTDVGLYIISYKRPKGNTMLSLQQGGIENFTIILGNDDEYYHEYVELYGKERVVVFDKPVYMAKVKYIGNNPGASGAAPARNFIRDLSISRGEDYHCTLDDDYITIEAFSIRTHMANFKGGWLFHHAINTMKEFLETTGLPYVAGSIPNSPTGCKEDWTTPSIVKKGFNSFVFNNKKWVNWRFKTADDVMLTLTNWNLGSPVFGQKFVCRMGMIAEAAGAKNSGNVAIYNSDLSWFKAMSAGMSWPNNNKAKMRYIKTSDQVRFAHGIKVVGAVPFILKGELGIKNKTLDKNRYNDNYKIFRYKG